MRDWDLERRAAEFWTGTDLADVYPRPIEQAIALKLPVTVVKLPEVTVRSVGHWLRRHHCSPAFPAYQRDLMGCLYADRGHGFIFVCGADEPEEQRFTLGHDTAHFLVDYWWPRLRVIEVLGSSVVDVLDGRRPASPAERVSAILAHVRVGPHWHLIPRPGTDPDRDARIARAEDRADDLGLELVAPRKRVLQLLRAMPARQRTNIPAACGILGTFFGLPAYVFGATVVAQQPAVPSFFDEALRLLGR
jgi:hypothetical protein